MRIFNKLHYYRGALRCYSSSKEPGFQEKPDPYLIKCDYIGPPDKLSNIRPYVRHIPKNETKHEEALRLKQNEVEEWNHAFWSKHNQRFIDEKREFIKNHKLTETEEMDADKLSVFYKIFLDKNRKLHILYNFSWYIKNFEMLYLAFKVQIMKPFKK